MLRRADAGKKGFTLVELLVVVAILSVLAALLLPSLEASVRLARRVACANQIRQWGSMISEYANDHRDQLPFHMTPQTNSNVIFEGNMQPLSYGPDFQPVTMAPYGMTKDLLRCTEQWAPDAYRNVLEVRGQRVYGYSYFGYRKGSGDFPGGPKRTTDIRHPTKNFRYRLVADVTANAAAANWCWSNHQDGITYLGQFYPSNPTYDGPVYLAEGTNVSSMDLSVMWIPMANLDTTRGYSAYGMTYWYWTKDD